MTELVERLRDHAYARGVTSDTPDDDVINETRMARDCSRAADEIERLIRVVREETWNKVFVLEPKIERLQARVAELEQAVGEKKCKNPVCAVIPSAAAASPPGVTMAPKT